MASGYKLIHNNPGHYVIQHPDGTHFAVAKRELDDAAHAKIMRMADGGEVPELDAALSDQNASQLPVEDPDPTAGLPTSSEPSPDPAYPARNAPWAETPGGAPSPATAQAPTPTAQAQTTSPQTIDPSQIQQVGGTPQGGDIAMPSLKGYGEQKAGIQAEANALGQQGKEESAVYGDEQKKLEAGQQKYDTARQDILQRRSALEQDINNGKIDPHRFWDNKSTGNKILAGLGVLLGGQGSVDIIQNAIKQDIDSQVKNLDTKQTLLKANFEESGDLNKAMALTTDQMLTAVKAHISQIAAKSQNPLAQARAKQAIGLVDNELSKNEAQYGLLSAKGQATGAGVPVGSPADRALMMHDKDYTKTRVDVDGRAYQATTEKEAEELRKMQGMFDPIKKDIGLIQSLGHQAIYDPAARKQAGAAMGRIAMAVNEFNGYTRFTDVDSHTINKMFNDPREIGSIFSGQGATANTLKALEFKLQSEMGKKLPGYKGSVQAKFGGKGFAK